MNNYNIQDLSDVILETAKALKTLAEGIDKMNEAMLHILLAINEIEQRSRPEDHN
jgi:hypothetical protein